VFCWPLDPIRIKKSMRIFGGFIAIGGAAVKTTIVYSKTFGILAVFLERDYVLTFTGVEKRSQARIRFNRVCREKKLSFDRISQGWASYQADEDDVVGVQAESFILKKSEEKFSLFCAFWPDQDEPVSVNISRHSPDSVDIKKLF
jgi:hypothetical protein